MLRLESKQDFYKLSRKHLLGNILRQWTWEQFDQMFHNVPNSLPNLVGVRHVRASFTNKGTSGIYPRDLAWSYGFATPDKENLFFDEGAVHGNLTIQGEVMPDERGLYMRYSFLQVHQRTLWHIEYKGMRGLERHQQPFNPQVLKEGPVVRHARGLQASAVLQKYLDASSWDCLNDIFKDYHYPVVEFASFKRPIGVLRWNTLFWEVRTNY